MTCWAKNMPRSVERLIRDSTASLIICQPTCRIIIVTGSKNNSALTLLAMSLSVRKLSLRVAKYRLIIALDAIVSRGSKHRRLNMGTAVMRGDSYHLIRLSTARNHKIFKTWPVLYISLLIVQNSWDAMIVGLTVEASVHKNRCQWLWTSCTKPTNPQQLPLSCLLQLNHMKSVTMHPVYSVLYLGSKILLLRTKSKHLLW